MKRVIPDEKIIFALMTCPTLKTAALSLGISEKTLYTRMRSEGFSEQFRQAQQDEVDQVSNFLCHAATKSIAFLVGVLDDGELSQNLRLTAARTILEYYSKITVRLCEDRTKTDDVIVEDSAAYFRAGMIGSEDEEVENMLKN